MRAVGPDAQLGPQVAEQTADGIDVDPGRHVLLVRRPDHFVAVFVRAGQEKDLRLPHGVKAADHVGHDGGVSVAEMGTGVHVVDRRGDVEWHVALPA